MPVEEDPPAGAPEWVVTYGDMMSLLLTFFIMLVSMSEIKRDDGKFRAMLDAIKKSFGPDFGTFGAPGTSLQTNSIYNKLSSLGDKSSGGLLRADRDGPGPGGKHASVRRIRNGTNVTLGGPVVFSRFSAELTADLKKDLDVIAGVVARSPNRIEVRGHATAEALPEDSPYADPFDLSYARAKNVADYLVLRGIAPTRLRVGAAGETEPRAVSADLAANRRVDVFLMDSYIGTPAAGTSRP